MLKKVFSLLSVMALLLCAGFTLTMGGCSTPGDEVSMDEDTIKISVLMHGVQIQESYKYRSDAMAALNEKLYKDLGFKVNLITTSYVDQFETMLALDMAAKINYDMIRATSGIGATYMSKNVLVDLKPLLDANAPKIKELVPAAAFAENTLNGKIFGIPTCSFPVQSGIWVRGDWLSKLGKSVPTNIAELEDLMAAMKANPEINPEGKLVPMAGIRDFMELAFLGAFTEHPGYYADENGQIQSKFFDPGYRKFVEKMAEWYQKGYIDDMVLSSTGDSINDLMSKGRVGMHVSNVFQLEYTALKSYNEQKNLDMKWVSPFRTDSTKYYSTGTGSDVVIFPSSSKVTDKVLQYYNWYYGNQENADLAIYGIEGKTYVKKEDAVSGKPFIDVPDSEKSDTILSPLDLIGQIGFNIHSSMQLNYTTSTRPAEAARAYDACNTEEMQNNYHMDIIRYFNADKPGTLGTKDTDSREMAIKRVSEMIVGNRACSDAEWDSMKAEFVRLGGQEVNDWYTQEYQKAKDSLTFLQ